VFRITPSGRLKVLHKFDPVHSYPTSGLTLGTDGNFYGATVNSTKDFGSIFKTTWSGTLTTLHSFKGGTDGSYPYAPPIQGTDGNFYGATNFAYKITRSGFFTVLGALPGQSTAPLLQATDGNFYGTTFVGGREGNVFKMTPQGVVTTVYTFDETHGGNPYSPLIEGSDGNFFGTTETGGSYDMGVVFKLTPQGTITVLHNFGDPNYPNDGFDPITGLVQTIDGSLYGVAYQGGSNGTGVLFQITPAGAYYYPS